MVLRHQLAHHFDGTLEVEALSRPHIQPKRDLIQFLQAMDR